MTKKEIVDRCNELFFKMEKLTGSIEDLRSEARKLEQEMGYLPCEESDIDDSDADDESTED